MQMMQMFDFWCNSVIVAARRCAACVLPVREGEVAQLSRRDFVRTIILLRFAARRQGSRARGD
jgi:hypothetical protein